MLCSVLHVPSIALFENRALNGLFGPEERKVKIGRRNLLNYELPNLCVSPNIIRRMRWA
jgi:hypothetical protein